MKEINVVCGWIITMDGYREFCLEKIIREGFEGVIFQLRVDERGKVIYGRNKGGVF